MWTDQTFDNTLCFVGRPCQNSAGIVLAPPGATLTPPPFLSLSLSFSLLSYSLRLSPTLSLRVSVSPRLLHLHMRTSDHVDKTQRDLLLNGIFQRDTARVTHSAWRLVPATAHRPSPLSRLAAFSRHRAPLTLTPWEAAHSAGPQAADARPIVFTSISDSPVLRLSARADCVSSRVSPATLTFKISASSLHRVGLFILFIFFFSSFCFVFII